MCAPKKPTVVSEYPKATQYPHVWEIAESVFDYTDEIESFSDGIYPSAEAAKAALDTYCVWLNQGS